MEAKAKFFLKIGKNNQKSLLLFNKFLLLFFELLEYFL